MCCTVQIYTQMSKLLGKVFFPSNDPVLQVSSTNTRPPHRSARGDRAVGGGGLVVTCWCTNMRAGVRELVGVHQTCSRWSWVAEPTPGPNTSWPEVTAKRGALQ
jgi:hypothetical protein